MSDDSPSWDDLTVEQVQAKASGIYHEIFNAGHAKATAALKSKVEEAEGKLDSEKKRADDAEAALRKAQDDKGPDAAEVRRQFEEREQATAAKHKETLAEKEARIASILREQQVGALMTALVGERYRVDPDYAAVIAAKPDLLERISVGDNEEVTILQAGKSIPMQVPQGQTAIELLAEEVAGSVPAKFKSGSADRGSGLSSDTSARPSGGGSFKEIRERQQKIEEGRKAGAKANAFEQLRPDKHPAGAGG